MNKQDYIDQIDRMKAGVQDLHKSMNYLTEKYITENAKFKHGDKVLVKEHGRPNPTVCFIGNVKVDYRGDIIYSFNKCKKDGTMASVSAGIYFNESIEPYKP